MLWNLTCDRGFHSALLEADVTCTLLELLGASSTQSSKKTPKQTSSTNSMGGDGGGGGGGGGGAGVGSATTPSLTGSTPSSGATHVHDGAGIPVGGEHSNTPRENGGEDESTHDITNGTGAATIGGAGGGGGGGLDTDGAISGGTSSSSSGGHTKEGGGESSKSVDNNADGVVSGVELASPEAVGSGLIPTLEIRRNVLGAVMNLTSFSIWDPRLDPKAVMSLLTLIMREDPNERYHHPFYRQRHRRRWW